jgi:hypothetical protein
MRTESQGHSNSDPTLRRLTVSEGLGMVLAVVLSIGGSGCKRGDSTVAFVSGDEPAAETPARPGSETAPAPASAASATRPGGPAPGGVTKAKRAAEMTVSGATEPSAQTRDLVTSLTKLEVGEGGLTPEQTAAWKQNLRQLIQQGGAAVPAIKEFLANNVDVDFGPGGKQALGYSSGRAAFFDALGQIGGPEAIATLVTTLQTTADPREIGLLSQNLEKVNPGQHRQEALSAAREALSMAAEGKLPDRDVGPLFEVLQKYGDAGTVADLERNSRKWNYYSMTALAQLPDGAGIPSLVQIAAGQSELGGGSRAAAIQMLAQVATDSETARSALVEQARGNKLSAYNWATLGPILAGDQIHYLDSTFDSTISTARPSDLRSTHISAGNQNFYTAPTPETLTPERLKQHAALIDELLAVATEPTAVATLQQSKETVARRMARLTADQPGGN